MILKIMFLSVIVGTLGQLFELPTDEYLFGLAKLAPVLNTVNLFDGPARISNAPTNKKTKNPTIEQMMYYNYYAASVYCPYELKNLTCLYCQKFKNDVIAFKVLNNNVHDTIALVTVSNTRREIVITYRGTFNVWNVVLDALLINGKSSNASKIRIHRGFFMATMSLYNEVVETVKSVYQQIPYPKYKIVIVGHSLGAAMARITEFFFLSLNQFLGAKYEVYTFGEPRVGNKYFVDFLNSFDVITARVVARADIVPHVPPTSILGTTLLGDYYIHAATEFWIKDGEAGQKFCNQTTYEDPKCSASLGPLYSFVDHVTYFDANYITCLAGQPLVFLALPLNILQPVDILPPLPKFISNILGGANNLVINVISPILGR